MFDIKIHNLVYTCFINTKINLDYVALKFMELGIAFDYNPKKFAAEFLRSIDSALIPVPVEYKSSYFLNEYFYYTSKTTQKSIGNIAVLLFSGGKMVCTGSKYPAQARFILQKIEEILKSIGYDASIVKYDIQNLVATHSVQGTIDIEELANVYSTFCTYDKQRFPGAIMRHPELNRITILVFKSGNLVITGAKEEKKVIDALIQVYPILTKFVTSTEGVNVSLSFGREFTNIEKEAIENFVEDFIVDQ